MPKLPTAPLALIVALATAALGAGMAPSAALAKPRPPTVINPPPPARPPTPGVGLGAPFVRDAAAYEDYMQAAAAVTPTFTDTASLDGSLRVGAAFEPGQLRRGAVAYAALEALDDAAFVDEVRRSAPTPQARYALVARIYANPASALAYPDGPAAAGLAKAALAGDGMQLFKAGDAVIDVSYTMQHQPWSLVAAPNREGRVAMVRTLSSTVRSPSDAELGALERQMVGGPAQLPTPEAAPYSPLVVRAVALAALAAAGQAGDDQTSNLGWLTDDYFMDHCLSSAKLATFECLAVAKPNYENAFCLGQYALKETGTCVVRAAGSAVPIEIMVFPPPHIPPAHIGAHPTTTHRRH